MPRCKGEFVFKSVEERAGGSFTDANGKIVKYDTAYVLKVDELTDSGIFERKLKIDKANSVLLSKLKNLKAYDKVNLVLDVVLYGSQAKVVPIDLDSNNK